MKPSTIVVVSGRATVFGFIFRSRDHARDNTDFETTFLCVEWVWWEVQPRPCPLVNQARINRASTLRQSGNTDSKCSLSVVSATMERSPGFDANL
jgi:hypothetical protein